MFYISARYIEDLSFESHYTIAVVVVGSSQLYSWVNYQIPRIFIANLPVKRPYSKSKDLAIFNAIKHGQHDAAGVSDLCAIHTYFFA